MITNETVKVIRLASRTIDNQRPRSAWNRGVKVYALELLETLEENAMHGYITLDDLCNRRLISRALLNGAHDWEQYSRGGCALIYDRQIAERLCTATELKITRNGQRKPNLSEEWLDTQARALHQAAELVISAILSESTDDLTF